MPNSGPATKTLFFPNNVWMAVPRNQPVCTFLRMRKSVKWTQISVVQFLCSPEFCPNVSGLKRLVEIESFKSSYLHFHANKLLFFLIMWPQRVWLWRRSSVWLHERVEQIYELACGKIRWYCSERWNRLVSSAPALWYNTIWYEKKRFSINLIRHERCSVIFCYYLVQ